MEETIEDLKLRELIIVCRKNKNFKKISVIIFIMIGNKLDEIAINLGIRPRDKEKGEMIFEYMKIINFVFEKSFKFRMIREDIIDLMNKIEIPFIKKKGNINRNQIKNTIEIYYELRKIEVPNVFEEFEVDLLEFNPELRMYSYANPIQQGSTYHEDKMKLLLRNNIENQQIQLQKQLNKKYNKRTFEHVLQFEKLKNSVNNERDGKILIKGKLRDNINYQKLRSEIPGYFLLGIFMLFMMLGLAISIQMVLRPSISMVLSPLILGFFGMGCLIFIIYWNNYHNEEI